MKVVDFDGSVLDATFSVLPLQRGVISLAYESSGGSHKGEPSDRNDQYRQGLNVLFRRLKLMNAAIPEIRIETGTARRLPPEEQRIVIPERPFPVALSSVDDIEVFRKEISRCGRLVGQKPGKDSRGGSSRRLRIFLTGVSTDQATLEQVLVGRGVEADAGAVATVVGMAAGRSRTSGQGFLVSHAVRKAVEEYAVAWAIRHYSAHGWTVQDVGSTESYDLRCAREGAAELHVEVKGTTGLGETVILTRNEVLHARSWPDVELFIVTEIAVADRDTDHPTASGGVAHLCRGWKPADENLTPLGYDYTTSLRGSAAWLSVV